MTVPASVLRGAESALETRIGKGEKVVSATPIGGGCINPSARLQTDSGKALFLKWNASAAPEMFEAEADGLRALASIGSLRIPEVIAFGGSGTTAEPGWLMMEFIPGGRPGPDYGRSLGEGLAKLHDSGIPASPLPDVNGPQPKEGVGHPYGWHRDNFIGSLTQQNTPSSDWTGFWGNERLAPQLSLARSRGYFKGGGGRVMDELMARLQEVMTGADVQGPALLHGDLWSGNFYSGPGGEPVLIDPAVYRGNGEVDLAMMELFGGFPRGFLEGYEARRRLAPEYSAFRRDLYQLYYLLVHVNLFGGGYEGGALSAAERVLRGS